VVVTGAGISMSAGIPVRLRDLLHQTRCSQGQDFRSRTGAFSKALEAPTKRRKAARDARWGRDMFQSSVLRYEGQSAAFYSYMTRLHQSIKRARPTETHLFLRALRDAGILVREYTQNIDTLSERAGLRTGMSPIDAELERPKRGKGERRDRRPHCVPLHGSLRYLRCTLCS
jgi:NAD-dependent histone deacetylase SIR2